ncbi:TonB-dependent receptor [Xanthomonadaceae bacterium XH05]|nr:TonB-dependent receptor [Xanthomonadaceae bacterium XH05]
MKGRKSPVGRLGFAPKPSRLNAALLAALVLPLGSTAFAQETETQDKESAAQLDRITVTGSLIPQSQVETFVPVTVITAEDIQARGFASVAEVLQQSSFSTGGVQGGQTSASFTQGAETMSMFGLPPGYVKYLIDGRPMANYPALYNGSDTFNNISGIPIDLVDRIEILPGGQSSLYGSDAIAGVVNFILKKRMDGAVVSVRGGSYKEPGGDSGRISLAGGLSGADGRLNVLLGAQYEERDPIWGFQRDLTSRYFEGSINRLGNPVAPAASRDFLVNGYFTSYRWADGASCERVTSGFNGGVDERERPGFGDATYCGSFNSPGWRTLLNGKEARQVYGHVTFDVSDNAQLYADVLYSDEEVEYHVGSNYTWWGTSAGPNAYFYDPDFDDLMNLQRVFMPEDIGPGGYENIMELNKSKAHHVTLGLNGVFGGSDWEYDVNYTRTEYKLDEDGFVRWADPIEAYFQQNVLGPQLGWDPYYNAYPVYRPDYAAFYNMLTPEQFASFTGRAVNRAKTSDDTIRAQLTNAALFSMPGGDAGLAVVAEWGKQDWSYDPYAGYLNGEVWGTTAVSGGGERDRYAVTSELRLPVWDMLTVSLSGRYDAYKPDGGETIDKPTYAAGLEFRPLDTLLIRGKYGTAFRAPTLSDQFQGVSGFYTFITDYYNCSQLGFDPSEAINCPAQQSNRQVFGTQSGNTSLQPINADVWSVGFVWAPIEKMSISVDYFNWDISDEVTQQSSDGLMMDEWRCRTGEYDINSALCQTTLSWITRNAAGNVTEIYTPKVNVSNQQLEAFNAAISYGFSAGIVGDFMARVNYTQKISHQYQQYAGDDYVDLINDYAWSSDPKRKGDASLGWYKGRWSSTLYANWFDKTPNYRALVVGGLDDPWLAMPDTSPDAVAGMLGSFTTYNWSVSYNPIEPLSVSVLVNNLFDRDPPLDRTRPATNGSPYNSYNFNPFGRAVYIEARYRFGGAGR